MNWLWAGLICIGIAALEALAAGKDPAASLRALRQPRWSPPFWAWAVIGVLWYAICFVSLARLIAGPHSGGRALPFLVALMAANGGWGILQFRVKRLDLGFLYGIPYALLLAAFLVASWREDRTAFWLFVAYAAYLPYATAWGWRIWRLNPR